MPSEFWSFRIRGKRIMILLLIALAAALAVLFAMTNPFVRAGRQPAPPARPDRLEADVRALAGTAPPRSFLYPKVLDRSADYIQAGLEQAGARTAVQEFTANKLAVRIIIGSYGPSDGPRLVLGAHYDTCEDSPGADDNASGIAGLLEIGRLLHEHQPALASRVDLVAFPFEEPPFYRTASMGSAVYAARLRAEHVDVRAMICLEMIGYFSDRPGTQSFPSPALRLFYPSRASFIAVVGNMANYRLTRSVKRAMKEGTALPVYSLNGPVAVAGIDFSDHRSFWKEGYPAVMITDTAFYRNPNYHTVTDTPDTLDYERMARVVQGVYRVVTGL